MIDRSLFRQGRGLIASSGLMLLSMGLATAGWGATNVSYRIDRKAWTQDVHATSLLTFSLYGDAECTALLEEEQLLASDPGITYELPQTRAVRGGPKPPSETVIRTVLSASQIPSPFFLEVSGNGVIPLGAPCQVQESAATAPSLRVYDGNGTVVGLFAGFVLSINDRRLSLHLPDRGFNLFVDTESGQIASVKPFLVSVHFDLPGCTGQAYVEASVANWLVPVGDEDGGSAIRFFIGTQGQSPRRVDYQSTAYPRNPLHPCQEIPNQLDGLVPAREILPEDLGISFPLALPLSVAP